MKCPQCAFDNPEGINFCGECGNKLEKICPDCKSPNPPQFKFCGNCGVTINKTTEPAKELTFDEKIDKIQRYLPKGITDKILSQKERIEGERKQVTVMFCDLEGFTSLVEIIGPEESYEMMDQIYEILIHKVHEYDGTVNEMTGDGVMALFGAPIALEDASQRAIRSAIAIHKELSKFWDYKAESYADINSLKMRIGIHTGPVVVGTLGNNLRVEFKAVGDTVNIASRMESLAQPGTTYVSEDIFKLTEGFFRFEALGNKQIKGKEKHVNVYRVITANTRKTRFDVGAERGLTTFVSRERELELLLDGFERAKSGWGQAFSIIAEAGVGKSRLLYEFRKLVVNEDVTFLEGKCLSFSKSMNYYPVIDLLKSAFDIQEDDVESEIIAKVRNGLDSLSLDEASIAPYLFELLSVRKSDIDETIISPHSIKDQITETVKQLSVKSAAVRPLIIAIEDLHWIDKNSEELLIDLLDVISGTNILLIFTYRPEFIHSWGGRSYHNQLNLNRLSNRESLQMAYHILNIHDFDGDLEQLILEKTEGVPFFIEEYVRSLIDINVIEIKRNKAFLFQNVVKVSIPSTIHDVIMARIDSLPSGAKDILQTGSVVEREFSYELIRQVINIDEKELLSQLSTLRDSELLYERGIFPNSIYIFKHALTRDVIYNSILDKRKMVQHANIAYAIEELYKNRNIDEHREILAKHYFKGAIHDKAAEHHKLASRKAEKAGSFRDAIRCRQNAIESLEKLKMSAEVQNKIIGDRITLGTYQFHLFYFIKAKQAIDPIIESTIKSGNKKRIAQIYTILGAYFFYVDENVPEAINYLNMALTVAEDANDIVSLFFANHFSGITRAYNCEYDIAVKHFNFCLDINIMRETTWGISVSKSSLSYWGYCIQGKIELAFQTSEEAIKLAEKSGDIYSKAAAYLCHGAASFYKGNMESATQSLKAGVGYCTRIRQFSWAVIAEHYLALTYIKLDNFIKAEQHCTRALNLSDKADINPSIHNFTKICLSLAMFMNNKSEINLETIISISNKNELKFQDGKIKRFIGKILSHVAQDRLPEAKKWIIRATDADELNGTKWNLGMDYAMYADISIKEGNLKEAKEKLSLSIDILEDCGADGWVKKYKRRLDNL